MLFKRYELESAFENFNIFRFADYAYFAFFGLFKVRLGFKFHHVAKLYRAEKINPRANGYAKRLVYS